MHTERYRSGHNEAVLKTVCPQGHVGSNPTLSAYDTSHNIELVISYIISGLSWRSTQVAEGTPLERVQVVSSGARVQIPPSPFGISDDCQQKAKNCKAHLATKLLDDCCRRIILCMNHIL